MDALCIYKNDALQLAVTLMPEAGVSFSLMWIGNAEKEIAIEVRRSDELGSIDKWKALQLMVGDKISFNTVKANKVDDPIESFTAEELETLQRSKPKMKPTKGPKAPVRDIGVLDCQVNNKHLFSFRLNTDNMLLVEFVWLGDRTGMCVMNVGLDGSSLEQDIPTICFGDEVTFRSTVQ